MIVTSLAPTQTDIFTALRSFLLDILPSSVQVFQGQDNRVPEPILGDFVVMTPLRRERLETNIDEYLDTCFVGSVSGLVLTVTQMNIPVPSSGLGQFPLGIGGLGVSEAGGAPVTIGAQLFGVGVTDGTVITGQTSGATGGVGTYTLSASQSVGSRILASGIASITQNTKVTIQLDVHGDSSANNAQTISTLFRDDFAFLFFAALNPDIAPCYADDPRQAPFISAEQQYENRWVVEAILQVNETVSVPQMFAGALAATLIEVEAAYPS